MPYIERISFFYYVLGISLEKMNEVHEHTTRFVVHHSAHLDMKYKIMKKKILVQYSI